MSRKGENIYKRKDGRWEGRVINSAGKYQYFYAKSYREVRLKMKSPPEKNSSKDIKQISIPAAPGDLFKTWLKDYAYNRLKPSTYDSYYYCINRYVIPHFELPENMEISEMSVKRFVNKISSNTKISESYRKKILTIFKIALREILKNVPECKALVEIVTLPKVKTHKEITVFSMHEQQQIEYAVQHSKDQKAMGILLCFYTGIRLGELCALKWADIDFEAGIMSVTRTVSRIRNFDEGGNKTLIHIGTPKSSASMRKIPLPAFLIELLKTMKLGLAVSNEYDSYILSGKSEPFDSRVYQKQYKKILREAGVRDCKFHSIRHTFATRALELGVDIKTLSEILGHANVSITLNIYAHSLMEQKKVAIEKFNEMHTTYMQSTVCAVNFAVMPH